MPQQNMSDFVKELEKIGQLVQIGEEKRVDELPATMEASPDKAVLVTKVKDCEFQFLAGAYATREQYAHALNCDPRYLGKTIAELSIQRYKPELVETAPCKEVILKGDEVDITKFPLFLYHPYDGHAFIQDTNVVSRDLETGLINWGASIGSCIGPRTKPTWICEMIATMGVFTRENTRTRASTCRWRLS
jgi:2,5-furandicarboxylate decarboxylase 1